MLFDTWFSAPIAILDIKRLGYDVVAKLKNHDNYRYMYNGEIPPISKIFKANKKRPGKSKYPLSVNVEVRHGDCQESVPAKIVFVRNSKKQKTMVRIDIDRH